MASRRNKPCLCGSGKKSKKCCESPVQQQAKARAIEELKSAKYWNTREPRRFGRSTLPVILGAVWP